MGSPCPANNQYSTVAAGTLIDAVDWNNIRDQAINELTRRGASTTSTNWPAASAGNAITAARLNNLAADLTARIGTFPYSTASAVIQATEFNQLTTQLNTWSAACLCNCNFCTCNCNFCTCNCNFCTCNCNFCTCNCNFCTCNCNFCTCNCNFCTCNCNKCCSDPVVKENIKGLDGRN